MNLIEHDVMMKPEVMTEATLPPGVLRRIKYPVMRYGQINRNGRGYEEAVAEAVLHDKDITEKLSTRSLTGNCEHPDESALKLDPDKTSHVLVEILNEKEKGCASIILDLLETKAGQFIDALFRAGCGIGTSTRADGELEEAIEEKTGTRYQRVIPEKYKFITLDFTGDPSTIGSYPQEIQDNVQRIVREGLASHKMDKAVATALIESIKGDTTETKKLLEADQQNGTSATPGGTKSATNAGKADGQDDAKGKGGKTVRPAKRWQSSALYHSLSERRRERQG